MQNEIKHAARVLSRYRDARRTRMLRIRLQLTVRVNQSSRQQMPVHIKIIGTAGDACRTEEDMSDVDNAITRLAGYGLYTGLIEEDDIIYTVNQILMNLEKDSYEGSREEVIAYASTLNEERIAAGTELEETLKELTDDAVSRGLTGGDSTVYRDLFDTRLMGCLTPRPSEVIRRFRKLYEDSPVKATDWYYDFSRNTDYIRRYRIAKDMKWKVPTEYGDLDITINLSKPEKDPKAIAAAKNAKQSGYPKCQLCRENEGYAGRPDHPARENHRVIPVTIQNSDWCFQYSPYVYYNEHCIVFNSRHIPMKIEHATFCKLFDFVKMFPHYFVGSNADLPIVGGSILSHDHFQGGHYEFAMAKAPVERSFSVAGFEDVKSGIVKWPMSCIRLSGPDTERIIALADRILTAWRGYTDEKVFIYAETDGTPHNTITPIARKRGEDYELDLVLRNNITTKEHPLGVFHPHAELHHIKKENIGLIEVMGLAVLPARLKKEMADLRKAILEGRNIRADEELSKHADWAEQIMKRHSTVNETNIDDILKEEIGKVFMLVLEDAGVFKRTAEGQEAFDRFIQAL